MHQLCALTLPSVPNPKCLLCILVGAFAPTIVGSEQSYRLFYEKYNKLYFTYKGKDSFKRFFALNL